MEANHPELGRLGIITNLDRGILSMYCQSWGVFVKSARELDALTVAGYRGGEVKSPLWAVSSQAASLTLTLAKEIGLTPVARLRMAVPNSAASRRDDARALGLVDGDFD